MTERWGVCKSCNGTGCKVIKMDVDENNGTIITYDSSIECMECLGTGHGGRAEDCPWIKPDVEEKIDKEQQRGL